MYLSSSILDSSERGYTLIEVLVAMTILILMAGGAIASYREFDSRQSVVNAGRDLATRLRTAQKRAQSGDKPDSPECNAGNLEGWRVTSSSSAPYMYSIRAICNSSVSSTPIEDYEIPSGVDLPSGPFSVTFDVLTGKADSTQTITFEKGSRSFGVQVTIAGGINEI